MYIEYSEKWNRLIKERNKKISFADGIEHIVPMLFIIIGVGIGAIIGSTAPKVERSSSATVRESSNIKDGYGHDKYDAQVIAEKVVKNNLKSPSSAEFCSSSQMTITVSGDSWTIKGWVDAQNGFGATLRNNFTVNITFTSSNDYIVNSCIIR